MGTQTPEISGPCLFACIPFQYPEKKTEKSEAKNLCVEVHWGGGVCVGGGGRLGGTPTKKG